MFLPKNKSSFNTHFIISTSCRLMWHYEWLLKKKKTFYPPFSLCHFTGGKLWQNGCEVKRYPLSNNLSLDWETTHTHLITFVRLVYNAVLHFLFCSILEQTVDVLRHQWTYSCEKAKVELDYSPRSLKEGLAEMLQWLKNLGLIKF